MVDSKCQGSREAVVAGLGAQRHPARLGFTIAAIALAVPWMAKYGSMVLMPVMLGAIYTFLCRGNPELAIMPATLLVLLAFVFWEHTAARQRYHGRRARMSARL